MGWYVTCSDCKQVEKYKHPNCDCRFNNYNKLLIEIKDQNVIQKFNYNDTSCKY